jgi:hypothetical protein
MSAGPYHLPAMYGPNMDSLEDEDVLHFSPQVIEAVTGRRSIDDLDFESTCLLISISQHVADLCLKRLEDRGEMPTQNGHIAIPHLIHEHLIPRTSLIMWEGGKAS